MIALYILGGLLLILVLILMLRVGPVVTYYGGKPNLDIKIGFIVIKDCFDGFGGKEEEPLSHKPKKRKKAKKETKKPNPKITDVIKVIKNGICLFVKCFSRYARLDKYVVKINLATDDPAKTALLYGGLAGPVSAIHSYVMSIKKRSDRIEDIYTEYKPDFYSEKPDIALEIGFSLRVWQILVCLNVVRRTLKELKKLPPKADKKTKGDTDHE